VIDRGELSSQDALSDIQVIRLGDNETSRAAERHPVCGEWPFALEGGGHHEPPDVACGAACVSISCDDPPCVVDVVPLSVDVVSVLVDVDDESVDALASAAS
jgi:hypothetical protein